MAEPAAPSFATRDEARAYVAAVLARTPPDSPGRVYAIVSPLMRKMPAMPKMLAALARALPGAELVTYPDLFRGRVELADRLELLTGGAVVGAVVLPRAFGTDAGRLYLVGPGARREADGLVSAGLPVLVFTPAGLLAWPDIRLAPAPEGLPLLYQWRLEWPPPSDVLLPTVAASFRAMGLPRPAPGRPRRARAGLGRTDG